jgi:hypothetical protein
LWFADVTADEKQGEANRARAQEIYAKSYFLNPNSNPVLVKIPTRCLVGPGEVYSVRDLSDDKTDEEFALLKQSFREFPLQAVRLLISYAHQIM